MGRAAPPVVPSETADLEMMEAELAKLEGKEQEKPEPKRRTWFGRKDSESELLTKVVGERSDNESLRTQLSLQEIGHSSQIDQLSQEVDDTRKINSELETRIQTSRERTNQNEKENERVRKDESYGSEQWTRTVRFQNEVIRKVVGKVADLEAASQALEQRVNQSATRNAELCTSKQQAIQTGAART